MDSTSLPHSTEHGSHLLCARACLKVWRCSAQGAPRASAGNRSTGGRREEGQPRAAQRAADRGVWTGPPECGVWGQNVPLGSRTVSYRERPCRSRAPGNGKSQLQFSHWEVQARFLVRGSDVSRPLPAEGSEGRGSNCFPAHLPPSGHDVTGKQRPPRPQGPVATENEATAPTLRGARFGHNPREQDSGFGQLSSRKATQDRSWAQAHEH